MDTDAPNGQESDYGSSPWVDLGAFESPGSHHSPPLPDFHGFSYGSSPIMPLEPAYSMSIPPPYSTINLTMPAHPWPSMLTTQSPFPETSLSPAPTPTLSIPQPVPIRPLHTTPAPSAPTPRRTLTDEDRRRMCLYHEENKSAKQTDIGALFGVERSTVSKVLRQKEKYLSMDDGSRSPIKRSKGKVPDIEKALANWARNYQRQGFVLTDAMIKEKAHFFATTCASPDGKQKLLTASWLEKFKQKNNLGGSKSRKNSVDTVASDGEGLPHLQSPTGTLISTGVSPVSPTGLTPSPLSPSLSQETLKRELGDSAFLDFSKDPARHSHSQSTTSLDTTPSLSAGVASPTSPLVSESPYTPTVRSRLPSISSAASRPRSQTFPLTGDAECGNGEQHNITSSKHSMNGSLSVSVVDSPLDEDQEHKHPTEITSDYDNKNSMKHRGSNSDLKSITTSMQPPPVPTSKSSAVSSPVSSPGSPTQDEARRALELVMNYIQNQPSGLGLQMQDYVTMGKLMEKLDLVHNNQSISGRLHRIDEDSDGPQMTKKRSINSLT
ncbi:conserved hypothetical protein [Talaromyces stipitatus ATCC 10500]|uniref:HTH CENPB-type domain-containing protein n=1 Tax=Talaromyces stipitatus (strain ATCC 10500 / CBS 375.48 / QM 6759 / NRRL 1006) TaxID=441959 RepID=B8M5X3_TALSN|nr:uncharacterized protein TSTA_033430 [Talaromyces stipitatus ATCC 10500]EED20100.1 conserved hypothetical protein [Talaromyces stipitatus ATCC 10500]